MADVFISYSRKDIQFAQRIHHELEARDREPWVDWQDIPPTAEWLDEVYAGIQEADTFLFIISPDSVVSEICTLEIEHAVQHNKRLVPVVLHDVDDDQVHSTMSAHNWVFLREEDNFEANFELLIDALDTDLEYVREHTRLLTLAIDWDKNQRRRSAVLRGQELKTAEGWLEQSGSKDPKPTELHREYLIFSRTVVNRLQRLVVSSVTVAFVLVLGLAVFSFHKSTVAEKTARISNSRSLAALALTEMDKDPELSILLARQSIRVTYQENRTVLPLSNTALRESIIKSRVRLVLEGHSGSVNSAIYSPGGQRIVTGSSDNTAKVWDANTGKELFTLKSHDGYVKSVAYGPDGQRIVTASADKTAKVWDAETEKELMTLQGHDGYVNSAVYSLDGQRIVTAGRSDKTAKIWDAQTGQELMTLQGHDGSVFSVAYSPDGERIVTTSEDQTAKVWDAETGQHIMTLNGHNARLNSAVWSSDGQRIITASWDETAKVWDANTGQELFTLTGHNGNVLSACWSPDQKRLMTSGQDGIVQIYTTDMDELLQIAESRITRQLTAEEKEKYGVFDLN
ncbi:hypothetical protein CMK17_15965 [Candidatus Poribacteria bacterium]|nr:hypothetical protein [Candidatus Poribacteria bacterium]